MIGRTISHYRFTGRISEGGMGTVYEAEDLTLKRTVAIKVIKATHPDPQLANERFLREAQAISQIDHPNVITVFEVIQEAGTNFLVMQYVQGEALSSRIQGGRLDQAEIFRVASEVAAALGAAHKVGVIHRDIKPENIVIEPSGLSKVLDFGIARLVDRSTLTRQGIIVGTLPYMAPEQIRGEIVDERTDVYALGVVLFEMLTGRLPFESKEESALYYQIAQVDPVSVSTLVPDVPVGVDDIVSKALSKDPGERYQTAEEMRHDLEMIRTRLLAGLPESERLFARAKRRYSVGLSIGAAILLIAVATFWRTIGRDLVREKPPPRIMVTQASNSLGQEDLAYLSGGIMDCLIASLGGLEGYNVVSRQTVTATKKAMPLMAAGLSAPGELFDAAREVGADYLITGSFAQSGGVVRISCELNDVKKGVLIESWSYDLSSLGEDFFSIMDKFATNVASALGATWKRAGPTTGGAEVALTQSLAALKYYQKGMEAYETGDLTAVADNMRLAIEQDPEFTTAYLRLASVSPEPDEVKSALESAMKYRHRGPPALQKLVEARNHTANDRIGEAIEAYQDVLAENPEDVLARSALGGLLIRTRRFEDAVAEYAVTKKINPFDYSYYPQWWIAYFEIGREDKALAILEDWRRRMPGESGPLRSLITINGVLGRWDTYLALCDTLEQISQDSIPQRGHGLIHLGRLDEAEEVFRQVVSRPDRFYASARGYTYLAEVSYHRGEYAEGMALIREALKTTNDYYNKWMAGRLAAGNNEPALARQFAQEIGSMFDPARDDSTTVEAFALRRFYYHLLGEIALRQKDYPLAIEMFETSLRFAMRVDSPFFSIFLARTCLESGDPNRAVAELDRALKIRPDYPEAMFYFGKALIAADKENRAKQVLERLASIWKDADDDYPLKVELDDLLETLGGG